MQKEANECLQCGISCRDRVIQIYLFLLDIGYGAEESFFLGEMVWGGSLSLTPHQCFTGLAPPPSPNLGTPKLFKSAKEYTYSGSFCLVSQKIPVHLKTTTHELRNSHSQSVIHFAAKQHRVENGRAWVGGGIFAMTGGEKRRNEGMFKAKIC